MNNAIKKISMNFLIPLCFSSFFVVYFFWNSLPYLSDTHWDVPGGSDAIFSGLYVKGMLEHGWFGLFDRMGAPFGGNFLDFPNLDLLLLSCMKTISLFFDDPSEILAVFYILGFYLIFFSCFAVFRLLQFSILWSMIAAFVFAILPFHFFRGFNHIMLSTYFCVPLWVWISLKAYELEDFQELVRNNKKTIILIALFTVIGSISGLYYAFFGMICLTFSVLLSLITKRHVKVLKLWVGVASLSCISAIFSIIPNIHFWLVNGLNKSVAIRSPIESDLYGLRISQILLPNLRHKIGALQNVSQHYSSHILPITEAHTSAMGFIASLGFVCVICMLFIPAERYKNGSFYLLSRLNIALILFTTVGGFGVIFAYLIAPEFRGLNRVSVFIAFISILFLWMIIRDLNLLRRFSTGTKWMVEISLATFVVSFAVLDQIPVGGRPTHVDPVKQNVQGLPKFVSNMETMLDPGAMIFMLPYIPFPEAPPQSDEGYNDMMRPIYYSNHLRWSYGSTRGRVGDEWLKAINSMEMQEAVNAIRKSGFSGVFVNRFAYDDRGVSVESDLVKAGAVAKLVSDDDRYSFFGLERDPNPSLVPNYLSLFGSGFYRRESSNNDTWNWSKNTSEIKLYNFSNDILTVTLSFEILGINSRDITVTVGNDVVYRGKVSAEKTVPVVKKIMINPGFNALKFQSDKANVRLSTDPRKLAFRVMNFSVHGY